jgi:hypothetical protein
MRNLVLDLFGFIWSANNIAVFSDTESFVYQQGGAYCVLPTSITHFSRSLRGFPLHVFFALG